MHNGKGAPTSETLVAEGEGETFSQAYSALVGDYMRRELGAMYAD
jgi:hypothetical protein